MIFTFVHTHNTTNYTNYRLVSIGFTNISTTAAIASGASGGRLGSAVGTFGLEEFGSDYGLLGVNFIHDEVFTQFTPTANLNLTKHHSMITAATSDKNRLDRQNVRAILDTCYTASEECHNRTNIWRIATGYNKISI